MSSYFYLHNIQPLKNIVKYSYTSVNKRKTRFLESTIFQLFQMKHLPIFFLALIISCSEEVAENPKTECRLTNILASDGSVVTQTTYTYNSSGKIDKQVRTRNGTIIFDYTYYYNTDGKVDKVENINSYTQYEFDINGKISSTSNYTKTGILNSKEIYIWSGNKVEIKFTKPGLQNPSNIVEYEFLNDNIVKSTSKSFNGKEPNVLTGISVSLFEDFDMALNPFYIVSLARPGYSAVDISKNNSRKRVDSSILYNGSNIIAESASTTNFSYTYNTSNAVVTMQANTGGTYIVDTTITYDQCK